MYTLMLTREDRQSIDSVGFRYAHGHYLYVLLVNDLVKQQPPSTEVYDEPWDDPCDVIYIIPEHLAWQIKEIGEEDVFLWTLFPTSLMVKMNDFCNKIV